MAPSVLVIFRGEAFRRGDVNTRRTDSCDFETEQKVAQSAFTCVLLPLLTTGADVTVFVDAIFARDDTVRQWYHNLWTDVVGDSCNLTVKVRKRLRTKTQKMGIVESLQASKAETYDFTIITRNNMIWKQCIPFSVASIGDSIALLSFNSLDFSQTRSGRRASRGMWHDYLRVEDKYIIVPKVRHDELKWWLTRYSDNVDVTQGMHDLSSPICGLSNLVVIWPLIFSSNTSLMENPIYTLTGRPLSRPTENVPPLGHALYQPIQMFGQVDDRHGKSFAVQQ